MAAAHSARASVIAQLPSDLTMERFDAVFKTIVDPSGNRPQDITIDLSEVRFILIECLPALIAEIDARRKLRLQTKLRLPKSSEARAILRRWAFQRGLKNTTKLSLSKLVDAEDLRYFQGHGGDSESHEYGMEKYHWRGKIMAAPRSSTRFDEIRHWDVKHNIVPDDPNRFQRAVMNECDRWCFDTVMPKLLERHLGRYFRYVWTHIIHEAMSNAFRHGLATSILSTSRAEFSEKTKRDNSLMLCFWDDGLPFYESLRRALSTNGTIAGAAFDQSREILYDSRSRPIGSMRYDRVLVSSKQLPTSASRSDEFLLSTLFPGITADVTGLGHFVHADVEQSASALPGMGLANLISGAVDVLGGSVVIRTGAYFMSVKRPKSGAKAGANYGVKIEERSPFNGNLLVVRLPLN